MFPSSSIVAVHPVTGRPLLPTLPTLPSRLRLSDTSDSEGDDNDNEESQEDEPPSHDPFAAPKPRAPRSAYPDHNPTTTTDPQEDEADITRYERERFDNLVSDLMTRYRSRRHQPSSHSKQQPRRPEEPGELEAQEEKDELLGHLMAKLRQEVVRVEEEGWMFGDGSVDRGGERVDEEGEGGYGYAGGGATGGGGGMNAQAGAMGGAAAREEVVAYE